MLLLAGSPVGVDGPSSLLVLPSTDGVEGAISMMTQEEFMDVQTLHGAGWTIRQIAEHVGYRACTR